MFGKFLFEKNRLEKDYLIASNDKESVNLAQFSNTLFASRPENQPINIPKIKVIFFFYF